MKREIKNKTFTATIMQDLNACLLFGGKLRDEEIKPNWHLYKVFTPEGDFYAALIMNENPRKNCFFTLNENQLSVMIADFLNRYDAGELD